MLLELVWDSLWLRRTRRKCLHGVGIQQVSTEGIWNNVALAVSSYLGAGEHAYQARGLPNRKPYVHKLLTARAAVISRHVNKRAHGNLLVKVNVSRVRVNARYSPANSFGSWFLVQDSHVLRSRKGVNTGGIGRVMSSLNWKVI
jgi:hypothetical protein